MLFFFQQFSLMFPFLVIFFVLKLVDFITLFTLVLLRPLGEVIFVVVNFYNYVLPFVPL
jgi:hypothetical protein